MHYMSLHYMSLMWCTAIPANWTLAFLQCTSVALMGLVQHVLNIYSPMFTDRAKHIYIYIYMRPRRSCECNIWAVADTVYLNLIGDIKVVHSTGGVVSAYLMLDAVMTVVWGH